MAKSKSKPQPTAHCSVAGKLFACFAEKASDAAGSPIAFTIAVLTLVVWAATGPMFDYSETWQIVINTVTTIITFLLVFLIQNSQNRETRALQLKLDELIFATQGAKNSLLGIEKLSAQELQELYKHYESLAQKTRDEIERSKQEKPAH